MESKRQISGGETHARKEKGHPSGSPKKNSHPNSTALRGWWCMVKPIAPAPDLIHKQGRLEHPPHVEGYTTKRKRLDGDLCGNCGGEVGHLEGVVGFEIATGSGISVSEYLVCGNCIQSGKPFSGALANARLNADQVAMLIGDGAAGGSHQ